MCSVIVSIKLEKLFVKIKSCKKNIDYLERNNDYLEKLDSQLLNSSNKIQKIIEHL